SHCCAPSGNAATGGSGNFCFCLGITIPSGSDVMPQTQKFGQARYVQTEVLATILRLIDAARENYGLVEIRLFLSRRLSTFRIEGSSDEILVTREDPKDNASRYLRSHRDFPAFVNEFDWVRDEAHEVAIVGDDGVPATLRTMFEESALVTSLEEEAVQAIRSGSPYAR
ncbi:hypothetical protein, partial [Zoogloea sp. 1C4]|uniref:hypothetical protein n=1 Tax=Zoogloea sp. 1C4 TaxID=2570190 RepID=UPI001D179A16